MCEIKIAADGVLSQGTHAYRHRKLFKLSKFYRVSFTVRLIGSSEKIPKHLSARDIVVVPLVVLRHYARLRM